MQRRYSIRRARPADLARILEIERASFGRDAYDRKLFADFLVRCGELFLLAERPGKICGYSITCIRGAGKEARAELVSIAVDPRLRLAGAATALLESTFRRLRRRRVALLALMVRQSNRRARAFYAKHGFTRVRIVRGYYEDGADGILMKRQV
ncbi:MAG TPA: GNAT family N-acetyltransferase [Bryobacteraceae bacterium]|nr:GNAT family N-acetyltransferase [Bryobacteraceae bacterium]